MSVLLVQRPAEQVNVCLKRKPCQLRACINRPVYTSWKWHNTTGNDDWQVAMAIGKQRTTSSILQLNSSEEIHHVNWILWIRISAGSIPRISNSVAANHLLIKYLGLRLMTPWGPLAWLFRTYMYCRTELFCDLTIFVIAFCWSLIRKYCQDSFIFYIIIYN